MSSQPNHSNELSNHNNLDCFTDSSRPTTASKRKSCLEEFELPPSKSRRLEFMKYRIKMDFQASDYLTQKSESAYHYYTIGDYSKSADEYEQFLRSRPWWRSYIKEGGQLVIIKSIFNLTQCYLALSDFDKAQITLQELYDTNSETAIGWGHSLFNELASLHSKLKQKSGDEENTGKAPEIVVMERGLERVQRRIQLMHRNGNHEGAIKLTSTSISSISFNVNAMGRSLKELLVELHLSLAEGYSHLGRLKNAQSTLWRVCNLETDMSVTWGHRLFKRIAKLHWGLKEKDL
ncbi:hypothetical protein MJO28_002038 [Puccinia striiformis f. sp. tritici]|uniref:Uncharacterized protein n=3 Tax=Puccinia striiformis TaxID=27350 RepID=A0A2S4V5T7_9BASI|nr:hypothetical protein MJO28_002038 [Puccinia striiformis f. sp. tritici]POV99936.1 hypothetical protein PSHT_13314 [Puccinia striiformis]POW04881.1 hypothetical protein PSTT_10105 [Puccinia striiformis]